MAKKDINSLLRALDNCTGLLNRRHLKKVYALLIACGHYPICPWCKDYIYNINDFTWDHIVPKSAGGNDDLNNLQPMHKHCNNASKNNSLYQYTYNYDIQLDLYEIAANERVTTCKKHIKKEKRTKDIYINKRIKKR